MCDDYISCNICFRCLYNKILSSYNNNMRFSSSRVYIRPNNNEWVGCICIYYVPTIILFIHLYITLLIKEGRCVFYHPSLAIFFLHSNLLKTSSANRRGSIFEIYKWSIMCYWKKKTCTRFN